MSHQTPHEKAAADQAAAAADTKAKGKPVKARLLVDCHYGKCNDVVLIQRDAAEQHDDAVKAAAGAGAIFDTSAAAVAYAESLRG